MIERFWDWDSAIAPSSDGEWWLKTLQGIGKELSEGVDLPLDILEVCLCRVDQLPSRFIQRILSPIKDALSQPRLLNKRLAVATCLSEVLRILAPEAPYDDNTMIEILQLIVDSFQSLDDFSSDPFGRRSTILENCANVKVSNLLLDLELQILVHDMFHHFLVTIKEDHDTKTPIAMESLMISYIEEMDEIPQPITSMLWVVRNLECVPSIAACKLVSHIFEHCEKKLISHLHKWEKIDGSNKDDALHQKEEISTRPL